ncbi:MAG: hypothetical protein WD512_18265 [Candidatus Paceibacterota bacterium]
MANVKKGQLVAPPQWWKHLKEWKKVFWHKNRRAEKKQIKRRLKEMKE